MPKTQGKLLSGLEKDVLPFIGTLPMSTIGPRDVLAVLRKMEARGRIGQRAARQAAMRAGFPVWGGYGQHRARCNARPEGRTGQTNGGPLCSHHGAEAGIRSDALDIQLHRTPDHNCGAQAIPVSVCASWRITPNVMGGN